MATWKERNFRRLDHYAVVSKVSSATQPGCLTDPAVGAVSELELGMGASVCGSIE